MIAAENVSAWFKNRSWRPFNFQLKAWDEFLKGNSGVVNAPTGTGKTFSVWGGILEEALCSRDFRDSKGIKVLWITPLRSLASDLANSLRQSLQELNIDWSVEVRTGDTKSSVKQRQKKSLPEVLITTPESLCLLLSYEEAQKNFKTLRLLVVDELHELIGTKRGTQVELCAQRVRKIAEQLRVWGLSATIGNLPTALEVLIPQGNGVLIKEEIRKDIEVDTIIPESMERFPWAGHLGLRLLPEVLKRVEKANTTLIFTNTRFHSEMWFQTIASKRPDWEIALHHGSLAKEERQRAEDGLRDGTLKCVVSTSSLDLGVDFAPVDLVVQVGSPKGVGRFIQRAGRSGHRPGETSKVICSPSNAFELIEYSALRNALKISEIEPRIPLRKPLDVLAQHLVTLALGGGFKADELLSEVRSAYSYKELTENEWQWTLDFVTRGGAALRAYPQFSKVQVGEDGIYRGTSSQISKLHRMSIGTIVSDASISVVLNRGSHLGTVEEGFMSRLKPGDKFIFAGKPLELVQLREMKAYVKKAKSSNMLVPKWLGGRLPLSSYLAGGVRHLIQEAKYGVFSGEEMETLRPIFKAQAELSKIPEDHQILIETLKLGEGYFNFIYPFEGRAAHEGLGALIAYRLSTIKSLSASVMVNDYGLLILSSHPISMEESLWRQLLKEEELLEDILKSLNSTEMAKRQFREIARVSGLIFQGYPGAQKSVKQTQISSSLLFDVFKKYDPENLLLSQANREILETQLEFNRLKSALGRITNQQLIFCELTRLTPFSFPIWVELERASVSSEKAPDRIERMLKLLEGSV